MSVCGQSLTGQELKKFKDLVDRANRVDKAKLDKKFAAIVQGAVRQSNDANLEQAIAAKVKKLLK